VRVPQTERRRITKQIAAMISETIGQKAPKLVKIASRMPATPIKPNVPVARTRR
jgi:hypothetical protein